MSAEYFVSYSFTNRRTGVSGFGNIGVTADRRIDDIDTVTRLGSEINHEKFGGHADVVVLNFILLSRPSDGAA